MSTISLQHDDATKPSFIINDGEDVATVERDGAYVRVGLGNGPAGGMGSQLFHPSAAEKIAFALLLASSRSHIEPNGNDLDVVNSSGEIEVQLGYEASTSDSSRSAAKQFLALAIGITDLKQLAIDTTDHEAELIKLIKGLDTGDLKRVQQFAATL